MWGYCRVVSTSSSCFNRPTLNPLSSTNNQGFPHYTSLHLHPRRYLLLPHRACLLVTEVLLLGCIAKLYISLGKFSRWQINDISYFICENRVDISCKLSPEETICMKCLTLFSWGKVRKNISKCPLKNFTRHVIKALNQSVWQKDFYVIGPKGSIQKAIFVAFLHHENITI